MGAASISRRAETEVPVMVIRRFYSRGNFFAKCDYCGKVYHTKKSAYLRQKRHFCSRGCYSKYRAYILPKEEQNAYGTGLPQEERNKRKKAREKGASTELIKFVEKNLDMWDKFINSRTFKDSVGFYAYESSLWDKLRDADEVDQVTIFKEWLEEREDEWQEYFADADELVHYSDLVNNDNWKVILKRLAEEW